MIKPGERENLWGYAKRLRFVQQAIEEAFGGRAADSLRVLDVGCGNGSQLALSLARNGFRVTGIDTDARSIEHARRLAAGDTNPSFICGRVEDLRGQSFDIVILSEVLEHLKEPEALLLASAGHLSEDGIMIVTVPNGYGEFEIDSWVFSMLRLQRIIDAVAGSSKDVMAATDNQESRHVQFFTRRRLRRLFADCSLSVFREGAASLLAGPLVGCTLARSERFIRWNAEVTDQLPLWSASGWYFALRRKRDQEQAGRYEASARFGLSHKNKKESAV
jgi:ubiquinone biosynthesis O-methyltransferase